MGLLEGKDGKLTVQLGQSPQLEAALVRLLTALAVILEYWGAPRREVR